MYWTNDSRGYHVTVALVTVSASAGRALTGGSPAPGSGAAPAAVVLVHAPGAGVAGAVASDPNARGSLDSLSRRAIVRAAVGASFAAPPSSVRTVVRCPPSSAVTRVGMN